MFVLGTHITLSTSTFYLLLLLDCDGLHNIVFMLNQMVDSVMLCGKL